MTGGCGLAGPENGATLASAVTSRVDGGQASVLGPLDGARLAAVSATTPQSLLSGVAPVVAEVCLQFLFAIAGPLLRGTLLEGITRQGREWQPVAKVANQALREPPQLCQERKPIYNGKAEDKPGFPSRGPIVAELNVGGKSYGAEVAIPVPTREFALASLSAAEVSGGSRLERYTKNAKGWLECRTAEDWLGAERYRTGLKRGESPASIELPNVVRHTFVSEVPEGGDAATAAQGKSGFLRFGSLGDQQATGFFSYEELGKLSKEAAGLEGGITALNERYGKALAEAPPDKAQSMVKLKEKAPTFFHLREELAALEKKPLNDAQKKSLQELGTLLNGELSIADAVAQRKFVLQQQMLFVVYQQMCASPPEEQQKEFHIWHQSLLNPKKRTLDEAGWMHDEGREIADTAAIFAELDGAKIVCDATLSGGGPKKGPWVEWSPSGAVLHLPLPEGVKQGAPECTLKTHYANISVQGHNAECLKRQTEINGRFLGDVRTLIEERGSEVDDKAQALYASLEQKIVLGKESSYDMAVDLAQLLLLLGIRTSSMGCQSAKDRTGQVAAAVMARMAADTAEGEEERKKVRQKLTEKILDAKGVAMQIVSQNCAQWALKVTSFVDELTLVRLPKGPIKALPTGRALGHVVRTIAFIALSHIPGLGARFKKAVHAPPPLLSPAAT